MCSICLSYINTMRSILLHLAEGLRAKFSYPLGGGVGVQPRPSCAVYVLAFSISCGVCYCIWLRVGELGLRTLGVVESAFTQGLGVQYMPQLYRTHVEYVTAFGRGCVSQVFVLLGLPNAYVCRICLSHIDIMRSITVHWQRN